MIEIIDNERILPGIAFLYKMGEDFPSLNQYNFKNIESLEPVNGQQKAFLFDPNPSPGPEQNSDNVNNLFKLIKNYKARSNE